MRGVLAAFAALVTAQFAFAAEPALVLREGSVASETLTAVGRDLVIDGQARSDVAVVRGNTTIKGTVSGDVVALGGNIEVASGGVVQGNAFSLGGEIELADGARVLGQVAAYPSIAPGLLALVDAPVLGAGWWNRAIVALKLGLAGAWLLWAVAVGVVAPRALRRTAVELSSGPGWLFATGLAVVLSGFLLVLVLSWILPIAAALPMILLIILILIAAKLWGIAALALEAGNWLVDRWRLAVPVFLGPLIFGIVAFNLVRFVPLVGTIFWALLTIVGVGAAARHAVARVGSLGAL